jgi:hypothetical protein
LADRLQKGRLFGQVDHYFSRNLGDISNVYECSLVYSFVAHTHLSNQNISTAFSSIIYKSRSTMAPRLVRFGRGTHTMLISHWTGDQKFIISRSSVLRRARYGPFSLSVIHKKGLCPSSGDINGRMMMNYKWV